MFDLPATMYQRKREGGRAKKRAIRVRGRGGGRGRRGRKREKVEE